MTTIKTDTYNTLLAESEPQVDQSCHEAYLGEFHGSDEGIKKSGVFHAGETV